MKHIKEFIKNCALDTVTLVSSVYLIYMSWMKSEGSLTPRGENLMAFSLAMYAIIFSLFIIAYYAVALAASRAVEKYKNLRTPVGLFVSIFTSSQGGGDRGEYHKEVESLLKVTKGVSGRHRGFFRKTMVLFFSLLGLGVVISAGLAGYIKTAVFLFIMEFIWFCADSSLNETTKKARVALAETETETAGQREAVAKGNNPLTEFWGTTP
jgi:hypothetical protein